MKSLIIFDCDGVLIESEVLANQCEVNALARLGYNISLEDYMDLAIGKHNRQVAVNLKEKFGIDLPSDFWGNIARDQKLIFEHELTAVEGVLEAIKSITLPTCVASGSSPARLHLTLSITGLLPHFEGRVFSSELVGRSKPFPDIFLYAANKMHTDPKHCIVIEDSLAGIEGALNAGMIVFAFTGGKHITPRLSEKLKNSGAHGFFDKMSDLKNIIHL